MLPSGAVAARSARRPRRRRHRRRDRQQQLGAQRQPHRARRTDPGRRPAPAVLGALELVRIRAARAGGRRRRRRASRLPRPVVGLDRPHRLGDHQQRRLHPRPLSRNGRSGRTPRATATATGWRRFAERQRDHPGPRRRRARADRPRDRARPGRQRARSRHGGRGRPAAEPALGGRWSTSTTSAPASPSPAPRTGRGSARRCGIGRSPCSTSSTPMRPGTSATRWPAASRSAAGSPTACATPPMPDDAWRGYIPFDDLPHVLQPGQRHRRQRQPAHRPGRLPAADLRRLFAGPSRRPPGRGVPAMQGDRPDASIALQNDVKNCRAARLVPHIVAPARRRDRPGRRHPRRAGGMGRRLRARQRRADRVRDVHGEWQEAVLGRVLPERLIPLCMQQTGLATTLLEEPARAFFAGGHRQGAPRPPAGPTPALARRLGRRPGRLGAGSRVHIAHWQHPLSRRRAGRRRPISARRRSTAARTRSATPAASCRRTTPPRARNTASWWISRARQLPRRAEHRQFRRPRQPALPRPVRAVAARRVSHGAPDPGGRGGGPGRHDDDHCRKEEM